MRKISLIVFLMLMPNVLLAYEMGTFNLIAPTELEKGQKEFKVQHRFKGEVNEEPIDNFFGLDLAGANVRVGLRYIVWSKLELEVSRIWDAKEYTAEMSYTYFRRCC